LSGRTEDNHENFNHNIDIMKESGHWHIPRGN